MNNMNKIKITSNRNFLNLSGRRCLVTGGAGFLGSHLCHRLVKEGAKVVVFDYASELERSLLVLLGLIKEVDYVQGDIRSRRDLKFLSQSRFDLVFHLAAQPISVLSNREPKETMDVNVGGTENLCKVLSENGESAIILASSACAYGIPATGSSPLVESDILRPGFYKYTESKQKAEQEILCADGIRAVIGRFINVYGPGDRHFSRIIPRIIKQLLLNESPSLSRGDGSTILDFLYIDDAVEGLLALARFVASQPLNAKKEIFNFGVGSINAISIRDLISHICSIHDGIQRDILPQIPLREPSMVKFLNPSKAHETIGWKAQIFLDKGLKKTIDWYRKHLFDIDHLEDDCYPFKPSTLHRDSNRYLTQIDDLNFTKL